MSAELDALLAKAPPSMAELARKARTLILDVRPDATERVWTGWKAVGFGTGTAMKDVVCMLSPAAKWVRMSFTRTGLPDPSGLLDSDGGSGAGHHTRLTSVDDLQRPAVRALIEAAFAAGGRVRSTPGVRKEREAGAFVISASKTVNVAVDALYHAWVGDTTRRRWLPDPFTIRKATENRSLRLTWADDTSVEVLMYAKGEGKSIVQIDHTKLADAEAAERARGYWKERLAALQALLEG